MSAPTQRAADGGKRAFYSRREVADSYDDQRFGGASGARVSAREIAIALHMLPMAGRVLDLACGTGRLTRSIAERGQPVVGLDYSKPMAAKTAGTGVPVVIGDAFATPFADGTFAAVVSTRFAFHWADLAPLLTEMRRLVHRGGTLVFDTYTWTPRSVIPLGARQWGGLVYRHPPGEVRSLAGRLGLRVLHTEPCFLFSPYLYRLAPVPFQAAFEAVERHVPSALLCRMFWQLGVDDGRSNS
ncbi:MAG TPA: class I SAM-dependent methyltransferase [Chloroflexota bacterium]|nr:class I SAM-dependent methyltransferase [Chloroflexota bacterium]